jgi:tRNA dimethylallyltransferase
MAAENKNSKSVIIIAGPTAVGKTAVAIAIARHFKAEIISADSRQCYKELNIGVARPSFEELQSVPHYFIASHSIEEEVTAASFEQYALEKVALLLQQQDTVVVAGGTGLYIRAFCEGLDSIPPIPADVRAVIVQQYEQHGLEWLQHEVALKDPAFYAAGEIQNPQRLMRALEVMEFTGQSIQEYKVGTKAKRPFAIHKIGLELPRETLNQRINKRVDDMMKAGLLDEVKALTNYQQLNALHTVGYSELFDYLHGNCSLNKATELIKQHTRQYAKRQMTWFKKDAAINWFSPFEADKIKEHLKDALKKS